ncbi:MAG TPA: hypothetical protein VF958_01445 [Thermoanaerobaculia bacterium]
MRVRRLSPVTLVLVFLFVASLSATPAQKGKPAAAPPKPVPTVMGWVDKATHAPGSGILDVAGWAADSRTGAPVARVEILLNERVVGLASTGEVRRDVVGIFKRNDYAKAGWKARIDLKAVRPGKYRVTARAWNARGESAVLNTGPVDIQVP